MSWLATSRQEKPILDVTSSLPRPLLGQLQTTLGDQYIIERERLSGGESLSILRNVAQALDYAHACGIVHRDIKPENVLLSSGTAVVADFGIAKALSASKTAAPGGTLTSVGTSIGTPAYMAPEQAVGGEVDHRADLYSWGVMAYELLSGAHPFARHMTPQALIAAHLTEAPKPLEPPRAWRGRWLSS